jgi:hypothetical protein
MLLVGCTSVNWQVEGYKEVSYHEEYYSSARREWALIEKSIYELAEDATDNIHRENEIFFDENYHGVVVFNIDSKGGRQIVDVLKEHIGEELITFINDMKDIKEIPVTREKVIGGYGVVCTNDGQKVSIRCIQSNISLIDENSKNLVEEIISPEFILSEMHIGKDNNMIQITTPMFIRNRFKDGSDGETSSYYQIFRKNTGEITKIRFVINKFGEEPFDNKHFIPMQNIFNLIFDKDTVLDTLLTDIKNVYENKKTREAGKVGQMKYKINIYNDEEIQLGELIEVVLDVK